MAFSHFSHRSCFQHKHTIVCKTITEENDDGIWRQKVFRCENSDKYDKYVEDDIDNGWVYLKVVKLRISHRSCFQQKHSIVCKTITEENDDDIWQ